MTMPEHLAKLRDEMVKEMRSALQRIDRECDNDNSVAWPIAYETLQSIEAMAKEQT